MKFNFSSGYSANIFRICLTMLCAGLLASCAPRISPPVTEEPLQVPADFPLAYYSQAETAGSKILRIDTNHTRVTILVRRGGVLARLGHEHVVASHHVAGYVDMTAAVADLYVPLQRLAVDEAELRTEEGLTPQLSQEAIEGTRRNMLDKVLESARFPFALVHIRHATGNGSNLSVTITLHGTKKTFEVPAQIEAVAGGIKISGQMTFNQTDFGITPFSILGGAMQVQDQLDLRFLIFTADHKTLVQATELADNVMFIQNLIACPLLFTAIA